MCVYKYILYTYACIIFIILLFNIYKCFKYIYIHITILFFCLIINNNYKINIYIDTRSITDKVWKLSIPKIYSIDIKKMTRDYCLPSLEKSNLTFSLENHQKRELPSQGRELIDKKTQRVFIYIYMITHRQRQ